MGRIGKIQNIWLICCVAITFGPVTFGLSWRVSCAILAEIGPIFNGVSDQKRWQAGLACHSADKPAIMAVGSFDVDRAVLHADSRSSLRRAQGDSQRADGNIVRTITCNLFAISGSKSNVFYLKPT